MEKPILYVDMDGVICDFYNAAKKQLIENPKQRYPQSKWGFFLKLDELPNAIDSINVLRSKYDVWILTRPSFKNVNCYTEKAQWVLDHLGIDQLEKTIFSTNKSLLIGDYLVDDSDNANQADFKGEWLRFGGRDYPNWNVVLEYLMSKN